MRDGGWKNKTTGEGWRRVQQQKKERAVSEYQKTQSIRLSAPKKSEIKYE